MGVNENKIVTVPDGIDIEAFKNLPAYGKFRAFSELTKEMSDIALIIICPLSRIELLLMSCLRRVG